MSGFSVKLGQNASGDQASMMDKIKNAGGEVIQVSDGLVVKSDMDLAQLQSLLEEGSVSQIDYKSPELSQDTKVFLGIL
jgi:hypothetical protein